MPIAFLNIAGITLALFFSLLVLSKKKKSAADKILVIWLLVIAYHFLAFFFEINELKYFNILIEFSGACVFLHGPLILAYVIAIHKRKSLPRFFFLHFIPFVINLALIWVLIKYDSYRLDITLAFFKTLGGVIYPIFILKLLSEYNRQMANYFSEIESRQMSWIKMVNLGILLLFIIGIISLLVSELNITYTTSVVNFATIISLFIYVGTIGYFGFKQGSIFIDIYTEGNPNQLQTDETLADKEQGKYLKTGLTRAESEQVFIDFQQDFEKKKYYLDPDITLLKLAEKTDIPINKLSQIINQNTDKNFFDFINTYRVNDVISQLDAGNHFNLTLLSIGFSAGFNSKTSFNRTFKKITGLTPSEYVRKLSAD